MSNNNNNNNIIKSTTTDNQMEYDSDDDHYPNYLSRSPSPVRRRSPSPVRNQRSLSPVRKQRSPSPPKQIVRMRSLSPQRERKSSPRRIVHEKSSASPLVSRNTTKMNNNRSPSPSTSTLIKMEDAHKREVNMILVEQDIQKLRESLALTTRDLLREVLLSKDEKRERERVEGRDLNVLNFQENKLAQLKLKHVRIAINTAGNDYKRKNVPIQ